MCTLTVCSNCSGSGPSRRGDISRFLLTRNKRHVSPDSTGICTQIRAGACPPPCRMRTRFLAALKRKPCRGLGVSRIGAILPPLIDMSWLGTSLKKNKKKKHTQNTKKKYYVQESFISVVCGVLVHEEGSPYMLGS